MPTPFATTLRPQLNAARKATFGDPAVQYTPAGLPAVTVTAIVRDRPDDPQIYKVIHVEPAEIGIGVSPKKRDLVVIDGVECEVRSDPVLDRGLWRLDLRVK